MSYQKTLSLKLDEWIYRRMEDVIRHGFEKRNRFINIAVYREIQIRNERVNYAMAKTLEAKEQVLLDTLRICFPEIMHRVSVAIELKNS